MNPAKNVLVFRLWKKLCIVVSTREFIILLAGDWSVKKFVLPENRSVNDLSVMDGISGDDAIEPGAPPVCGGAPDVPVPDLPLLVSGRRRRLLLFFFDVIIITRVYVYYYTIRDSISN